MPESGVSGDKVSGDGSHSGGLYSQKHLSPHRMMHFGKRPLIPNVPLVPNPVYSEPIGHHLVASRAVDLYRPAYLRRSPPSGAASSYSSSFDLSPASDAIPASANINAAPSPQDVPYLFSIELQNGQTLNAIPEG